MTNELHRIRQACDHTAFCNSRDVSSGLIHHRKSPVSNLHGAPKRKDVAELPCGTEAESSIGRKTDIAYQACFPRGLLVLKNSRFGCFVYGPLNHRRNVEERPVEQLAAHLAQPCCFAPQRETDGVFCLVRRNITIHHAWKPHIPAPPRDVAAASATR